MDLAEVWLTGIFRHPASVLDRYTHVGIAFDPQALKQGYARLAQLRKGVGWAEVGGYDLASSWGHSRITVIDRHHIGDSGALHPDESPNRCRLAGMSVGTVPKLRKALKAKSPGLSEERLLWEGGADVVVGIDEVGRGAWAGPLTLGAAVVPKDRRINKIRDSKMLTEPEREAIFDRVVDWVEAWGVGHASHEECDLLGMSGAQRLAASRALANLGVPVDAVILDGNWDFVGHPNTRKLVKADAKCLSVAAASILAKVTRDRMMKAQAEEFPGFDFDSNKGYPCPRHKTALQAYGPTSIHRRSWVFMDHLPWSGLPRTPPAWLEIPGQGSLFG